MTPSFHCKFVLCFTVFCSLTSGATSANVKIYLDASGKEPVVLFASSLERSYGCQSLRFSAWNLPPIHIFTDTCIKFYQNQNCNVEYGSGRYVLGRKNSITYTELPGGFQSFDLCSNGATKQKNIENVTSSAQLFVNIHRSVIRVNQEDGKQTSLVGRPQKVVQNHGKELVSYEYLANITIQENLKIHRPAWLNEISKLTSTSHWRVKFEEDNPSNKFVPFFNQFEIHSHIQSAFAYFTEANITTMSSMYSVTQPQTFCATEFIPIPACRKCNIESSIHVTYQSYWLESSVDVTGVYQNGQHIPSEILKDKLPEGLWYEDTWNDHTIQALSVDTIEIEYGNALETNSVCKEIRGCQIDLLFLA